MRVFGAVLFSSFTVFFFFLPSYVIIGEFAGNTCTTLHVDFVMPAKLFVCCVVSVSMYGEQGPSGIPVGT